MMSNRVVWMVVALLGLVVTLMLVLSTEQGGAAVEYAWTRIRGGYSVDERLQMHGRDVQEHENTTRATTQQLMRESCPAKSDRADRRQPTPTCSCTWAFLFRELTLKTKGSRARPVATGVHFYVPAIFDPTLFPHLQGLEDEARWMLHKIITSTYRWKHDPW